MTPALASQEAAGESSYPSVLAERQQIERAEPLKVEQMIKWFEQLWLTGMERRKTINEGHWQKLVESLKEIW